MTDKPEPGMMEVEMKADPNPNANDDRATIRIKAFRHRVDSFKDASRAVRHFIETNNLGSGNWTGGRIFDDQDRVVGRVSFNGRVWDNDNNEIGI